MLSRMQLGIVSLLAALTLAGCGGRSSPPAPTDTTAQTAPYTRLPITAKERQDSLGAHSFSEYVKDRRVGVEKNTLTREPDGSYVYRFQETMMLVYKGEEERSTVEQTWTFAGSAPYALVWVKATVKATRRSDKKAVLERAADGYRLTVSRGGFTHEKNVGQLDYTLDDFLTPDVWVDRPHEVGDTMTVRSLSPSRGKVRPVHYRILPSDKAGVTVYEITDNRGNRRQCTKGKDSYVLRVGCLEVRQDANPVDESAIQGVNLGARVRVQKEIGDPRKVENLTLKATGPLAALLTSGPGQTVTQHADGSADVTLSAQAPAVFASRAEIDECLEDSFDTPHRHAEVQELLHSILGDRRLSRKETAEKLIDYLKKHLTYDAKADPDSVIELIHTRRGVCRHFAALLTTLLRGTGIPARNVFGLGCAGDAEFGGHAWTELVLEDGTWLSVDPTFGQMKTTTHIRFPQNELGDLMFLELDNLHLRVIEVNGKTTNYQWLLWLGAGGLAVLVTVSVCRWQAARKYRSPW